MKNLVVHKYGGSSLSSLQKIQSIAQSLAEISKTQSLIVVVSAMGKATDDLLNMAYTLSPDPERRELDMLLTAGERISMSLLSIALNQLGVLSVSFTGSQAGILTSSKHNSASIVEVKPFRVEEVLTQNKVAILAGFQGVDPITKEVTTLGRGGSDTTAVYLADHFKAECEIYKDVEGVCSGDPNQFFNVTKYDEITYDELIAMTKWGNPILHRDCIKLAKDKKLQLKVKKSLSVATGTQVVFKKQQKGNGCLSIESHLLVFSIKKEDQKSYNSFKEKEKLFSLYDLHTGAEANLIVGEKLDLQLLKKRFTPAESLASLSTVSFILSGQYLKDQKRDLKNKLFKKFPSVIQWIDEEYALTAVVLHSFREEFLKDCKKTKYNYLTNF